MKSKLAYPLIAFLLLVALTLACGESNTGEKVGEQGESSSSPTVAVYTVGDIIKVGDHTIVLNSAEFQGNVWKANFTIENKGADEINVSSMMSFYARDSEGTKLEQKLFDCGASFDGKVLPGDKIKGDICWSGAATDSIKIYYEAELFGSGAVVWEVTK